MPISFNCVPLDAISDGIFPELESRVFRSLSNFECSKSPYLERFARNDVKRYADHGHGKTYLFLTNVNNQRLDVAGFFTVGLQSLSFEQASNSTKKKFFGDFSYERTGAYLIAQLARSDRYTSEQLPGSRILKEVLDVIAVARKSIGGRFLVVDCQEVVFEKLYAPNGFKRLKTTNAPLSMPDSEFVTAGRLIKDL